jgi:hypothetical protein
MLTKQEAFDIVAKHLFAQGRRSSSEEGMCLYRGRDGLKCAIGALIPDDQYRVGFEDNSASNIMAEVPVLHSLDGRFLDALQGVHDRRVNWDPSGAAMKAALLSVARCYCLDPAILDTLSFNRPAEA